MAAIHELLAQVQDESLRARLEDEINKLSKQKKFGLVFEEHLPECTPLYDIPVKVGSSVAKKDGKVSDMYVVIAINSNSATCIRKMDGETEEIPSDNLVCVAEFGEPIYPFLKPIDDVCHAPDNELWHTLIEADNYHALQLLEVFPVREEVVEGHAERHRQQRDEQDVLEHAPGIHVDFCACQPQHEQRRHEGREHRAHGRHAHAVGHVAPAKEAHDVAAHASGAAAHQDEASRHEAVEVEKVG